MGKILVEENGKQEFYKPEAVERAHKKSKWNNGIDFSCWAMCLFCSHEDFDSHHESTGETCDYVAMKAELLDGISLSSGTIDWGSLPSKEMDASWLDLGDSIEGIEGIGNLFGGIFDAFS